MNSLVFNERSWAIDLISEINLIANKSTSIVRKASGEAGLRTGTTTLFPDVVIHGDTGILQGWELKLPDTKIYDTKLLQNAADKADLLGTNSFLVWNGGEASLWARTEENPQFHEVKTWVHRDLYDRKQVEVNKEAWLSMLHEILNDLSFFYAQGLIREESNSEVLDEEFASRLVEKLYVDDAAALYEAALKNEKLRQEVEMWSIDSEFDFEKRFVELAKLNILSWINRFIFCHYLCRYNPVAHKVRSIEPNSSIAAVKIVFQEISAIMDFGNIFVEGIGDSIVSPRGWKARLEFNALLTEAAIYDLPEGSMRNVLESFAHATTRKSQGQFATPKNLALALANLSLSDLTAHASDPCCGSGTIARSIYDVKVAHGVDRVSALESVWASDKYQMPLQLTSISLSDPLAIQSLVQVFRSNVFDLHPGMLIEFTDPQKPGIKVQKALPQLQAIASNLPYVRQEILDGRGPDKVLRSLGEGKSKTFGKADLYAAIIFDLDRLLAVDGRIAVIVSNSWLGTQWGIAFQDQIREMYDVRAVIKSGNGRWFAHAKVITTILILDKKRSTSAQPINFVTTAKNLNLWNFDYFRDIKNAALMALPSSHVNVIRVQDADLEKFRNHGLYWRIHFFASEFVKDFLPYTVPLSSHFDIARGARTGQDDLFYPEFGALDAIEKQYLVPFIKNPKELSSLIIRPNNFAFSCDRSMEELKELGHFGALSWIRKFENRVNGKGRSLAEILGNQHQPWYYLSPKETGEFAMALNPFRILAVYRAEKSVFMNQRLIRLKLRAGDPELFHALLNSAFGMLAQEFLGFGRGQGVLDLRVESVKNDMRMLDPSKISSESAQTIKQKFRSLASRDPLPIFEELEQKDRLNFETAVLQAFGLESHLMDLLSLLRAGVEERLNAAERGSR